MPNNARWLVASKVASKLGDLLCSPKTVLPWLLLSVGAPSGLLALLVPVRESGTMLPQLFIAPWVQRVEPRKTLVVGALFGQALVLVGLAGTVAIATPPRVAIMVVVMLGGLSLARAFASLAVKDVLARAVRKGMRGKVDGTATSLAGLLGIVGVGVTMFVERPESTGALLVVVGLSAVAFVIAGALMARVREEGEGRKTRARVSMRSMLRTPRLRRFIFVRTLLAGSALGGPFIVALGRDDVASLRMLSAFVIGGSLASFLSARAWGRLADASGRGCMALGGGVSAAAAACPLVLSSIGATLPAWSWPLAYFVFAVGYVGVRVGRKTYVIDIAEGAERTAFVAASNTTVAVALLLIGAAMAWVPSATGSLVVCVVLTSLGAVGCARLSSRQHSLQLD